MDIYDLLIENLGMWLAIAHRALAVWIDVPANASGPLDPSITLTGAGQAMVNTIALTAIDLSHGLVEAVASLFW